MRLLYLCTMIEFQIEKKKNYQKLVSKFLELGPWGHYFKVNNSLITGYVPGLSDSLGKYLNLDGPLTVVEKEVHGIDIFERFNHGVSDFLGKDRRQSVLTNLAKLIDPKGQASCLDIGCAEGMKSFFLASAGFKKITAVDIRQENIERAEFINSFLQSEINFKIETASADTSHFLENHNNYDFVFSLGVMHHLNDHRTHIKRLRKLTKRFCFIHSAVVRPKPQGNFIKKFFTHGSKNSNERIINEKDFAWHPFKSITERRSIPSNEYLYKMLAEEGFNLIQTINSNSGVSDDVAKHIEYLVCA